MGKCHIVQVSVKDFVFENKIIIIYNQISSLVAKMKLGEKLVEQLEHYEGDVHLSRRSGSAQRSKERMLHSILPMFQCTRHIWASTMIRTAAYARA